MRAAASRPLTMAYEANNRLPLASPVAVSIDATNLESVAATLRHSQSDHSRILAALVAGAGSRAEALMREHAQRAIDSFLERTEYLHEMDPDGMPGLRLIAG